MDLIQAKWDKVIDNWPLRLNIVFSCSDRLVYVSP